MISISLCPNCNCMTKDIRVNNTRERTIICGKCGKNKGNKEMISLCSYCNCLTRDLWKSNKKKIIICGKCKKRKYVKKKVAKSCANCKWQKLKFHKYKGQDYIRLLCKGCLESFTIYNELCHWEARGE